MRLRTRIIVGFLMIILVPLLLFAATLYGLGEYQAQHVVESQDDSQHSGWIIQNCEGPADDKGSVFFRVYDSGYHWSVSGVMDLPKHGRPSGKIKEGHI